MKTVLFTLSLLAFTAVCEAASAAAPAPPGGLFYPIVAAWVATLLCYSLAGVLIWRGKIKRNTHIMLTVAGFLIDFGAMFMQMMNRMQMGKTVADLDPYLSSMASITLNFSMGLYCLVALFGFSRMVGWHKLGRWHVPLAMVFMGDWLLARWYAWQVLMS